MYFLVGGEGISGIDGVSDVAFIWLYTPQLTGIERSFFSLFG